MRLWKAAAAGAALLAAGAGSGLLFPTVHAQSGSRAVAPRALEVLGGRGSQIGVTIRDVDENDAKAGKMPSHRAS